jgi:hypothetical protein
MRIYSSRNILTICVVPFLVPLQAISAQDAPEVGASDRDFILVEDATSAERAALAEVTDQIRKDPTKAPEVVTRALEKEVPNPVPSACQVVGAAISGFDRKANRIEIARMIFAAVKARTEETLSIVGVAIENLPDSLHRDIVGAAVAALPDPYVCVSPSSLRSPPCSRRPNLITYEPVQSGPCKELTLAEAIRQQALLSGTNQGEIALSTTINEVLRDAFAPKSDPAYGLESLDTLLRSNSEWDTVITKDPPSSGPTPPPTPPPVSP